MGVATGDYDNDGDQDLYVTALGPNTLYRNNGDGTFSDVTAAAGVGDDRWSTAATFVDYDRDGDLDLFVVNYLDFSTTANKQCFDPAGARDYCGPRAYRPVPDRLFRNEGGGRFTDVSEAAGITKADGAGLGVATGDYNGDGWLDLYVANDATPNQLWMNQKNGTFVDEGPLAGVALNAAGVPEGSMGIASGDYDRDGDEDLFVTNIIGETFALYTNDGRGGLRRHARPVGARPTDGRVYRVSAQTGSTTTTTAGWISFVANGAVNIIQEFRGEPVPYRMRNQLFRNLGTGKFVETSGQAGRRIRTRRGRQGCRLRRHRQRRRHRRPGDQQHGARPPVAESGRHAWLVAAGAPRQRPSATASVSAPSCTWSALARRRSCVGFVPMAAICARRIRRCSSVSASGAGR